MFSLIGIMMDYEQLITSAVESAKGIEYESFTTSLRLPESAAKEEENVFKRDGIIGKEALKTRMGREVREKIEKISGKKMDLNGDIVFKFDLDSGTVGIEIKPLFLLCKYRKLVRGISQTRWDKYDSSVEGFIVDAAEELYGCTNAFLHGSGREDVDVRMLGDGRICVVEIVEPRKRSVDAKMLEERVRKISQGAVELRVIRQVGNEYVWITKEAHFDKEYEAEVEFNREIDEEMLGRITAIRAVEQRTPLRVKHRRADMVRKKHVLNIEVCEKNEKRIKFRIKTEAGTYIKELISGDDGRTRPSFAEAAGCTAKCTSLDVINVYEYISEWW